MTLLVPLQPAVIAIDGPGASGKSTVAFRLAERIDYLFFDTGVLYRAVTWAALELGVAIGDEAAVTELTRTLAIDVAAPSSETADGRHCTVLVDGRDVTWLIRTPQVDQHVSIVSAYAEARQILSDQQRRIGARYGGGQGDRAGVVMVGRDIGTIVMPDAALKIYMIASAEERARRRYVELTERGRSVSHAEILQDLLRRDQLDSERAVAPLRPAEDAFVIDTSQLTPDEVVQRIIDLATKRVAETPAVSGG